ncbi:L10-interacting MYB domain-containing protein-like [Melia azedarach]|uniref:L10-interacting MYB domain-containing protein-like n=1 Tax=Melia azedarach TaxID=155640 RepID=A0ACC1Y935_MELAZ|nr:L10-interacting MYB domain-containing protein-like [Melia azedarach]
MSSSTDDSDDDLVELMTLPLIFYRYLRYMDEESSSTDDDTSSGSSVVSMPVEKRQKVSKEVGVVGTSSCDIAVPTQEGKREEVSNGVGNGGARSGVVATQEKKREEIPERVGVVHNASCNAFVPTQGKKIEYVSKGVGIVDTSSHNDVVSTQGEKRQESAKGVEVKVSQQLDYLLEALVNKSIQGKDKPGCSIKEVMQIVEGMPEIAEDEELFMKAADILTDRQNREMFIALKEKNRRIMWLKRKRV